MGDPDVGHESLAGRLSIPYLSPAGVVGLRFRCLRQHKCSEVGCPKYLPLTGHPTRLYNVVDLHRPEPYIAICEGETDTIVTSWMVKVPAVGLAGGGAWKPHFPRIFADYERVFVVMDNDDKGSGENPGENYQQKVVKDLPQAVSIRPPFGLDVNEWYLRDGPEAIRKAMGL